MQITKTQSEKTLTIALEGRLDTTTAPQLESEVKSSLDGVEMLILDFSQLQYLSSAGLRVILSAQKKMGAGRMQVLHVNEAIMEIFEVTGFTDILDIA